jgi:hypothetical protein
MRPAEGPRRQGRLLIGPAGNFGGAAERKPVPDEAGVNGRASAYDRARVSSATTPRPGRLTTEKKPNSSDRA